MLCSCRLWHSCSFSFLVRATVRERPQYFVRKPLREPHISFTFRVRVLRRPIMRTHWTHGRVVDVVTLRRPYARTRIFAWLSARSSFRSHPLLMEAQAQKPAASLHLRLQESGELLSTQAGIPRLTQRSGWRFVVWSSRLDYQEGWLVWRCCAQYAVTHQSPSASFSLLLNSRPEPLTRPQKPSQPVPPQPLLVTAR